MTRVRRAERITGWLHVGSATTLVVLALLLALVWRAEVEWHGWEGLIWVAAPHRAVPVGVVAFVAWTLTTEMAPTGRVARAKLLVFGVTWAAITLWLLDEHLRILFGRWFLPPTRGQLVAMMVRLLAVSIATPIGAFLLGRATGARLRLWTLPVSITIFLAALPLGMWVLPLVEPSHTGIEHAVKTGAAVPFAVLGMGIPWVTRREAGSRPPP